MANMSITQPDTVIYTVSALNQEVRQLLEYALPSIWIEGEISTLRTPGSGHYYFYLKDSHATVRCALFRNRLTHALQLKDGMQVLVRAAVSLYEGRGDFQLIIEHIEEAGDGKLRRAFEALKQRLAAEGLFDAAHKKPLPTWPRRIGVITSPTGAAIRDILHVLQRRAGYLPVIIYPTAVQGAQAAGQIVQALQLANQRQECDVLIVARGGGSLEDLWPFNEESVARALFASSIPTITGIGHEIDITIADLVADQRAPTPSAAAEMVSPDSEQQRHTLEKLQQRLTYFISNELKHIDLLLHQLAKRLPHPERRLHDHAQRLDALEQRLRLAWLHHWRHKHTQLQHAILQLQQHSPALRIRATQVECSAITKRLQTAWQFQFTQLHNKLTHLMQTLDNASPLNILNRGYALATTQQGEILRDTTQVAVGDALQLRLARGVLQCVVKAKEY